MTEKQRKNLLQKLSPEEKARLVSQIVSVNSVDERYYQHMSKGKANIVELFFIAMRYIKPGTIRALDVGCGMGNILVAMNTFFSTIDLRTYGIDRAIVHGIEIDPVSIAIEEIVTGSYRREPQNALTYKDYKDHNLIYYYHPIRDKELQVKLENKIEKEAKKDTIIICCHKAARNRKRVERNGCEVLYGETYDYDWILRKR